MKADRWKVAVLAVALDLLLGEPPERWHPVVWMGRLVKRLERAAPADGAARQLAYGGVVTAACQEAAGVSAGLLERLLRTRSALSVPLLALALKPAFAIKALFQMVGGAERALAEEELPTARRAVGRIVSRDVTRLDGAGVAAAAVESLAENAADSVVAPLLYYSAFGLPGAYRYRMSNTLDAMLGYRGEYEYLGKAAARLDDLLNLVPSRLTALVVVATCRLVGGSPRMAWRIAVRDSSRTASPNAGWPMAAVAGALDLRLEKAGHYVLNPEGRPPSAEDIRRARRLVGTSLAAAILSILLLGRILQPHLSRSSPQSTRRAQKDSEQLSAISYQPSASSLFAPASPSPLDLSVFSMPSVASFILSTLSACSAAKPAPRIRRTVAGSRRQPNGR